MTKRATVCSGSRVAYSVLLLCSILAQSARAGTSAGCSGNWTSCTSTTGTLVPDTLTIGTAFGRFIQSNGIPDHLIGVFPLDSRGSDCGRPSALAVQSYYVVLPPAPSTSAVSAGYVEQYVPLSPPAPPKGCAPLVPFGIAVNGIPFDPMAAEWWDGGVAGFPHGDCLTGWQKNSLQHPDMETDLDCNHGHIQNDGGYHYHGLPTGLYERLGGTYPWRPVTTAALAKPKTPSSAAGLPEIIALSKAKTILLGWGFDGNPVYGPTCMNPAPYSVSPGVPASGTNWWKPRSCYRLKGEATLPDGSVVHALRSDPSPDGSYNGDYDQDYEFRGTPAYGDLDECNGHFAATPEYPSGVYHYHITEEFPYIPRCYRVLVKVGP